MPPDVVCSACGYELGPKEEEIEHPEQDNNPDNPHYVVQIRDDGEERLQCQDTGQLAKPVPKEQYEGSSSDDESASQDSEPTGEGQPTEPQPPQQSSASGGDEIFDFEEEKDQMQILADVVTNPHYELKDPQIKEVMSWAQDYDGQMPPNVLEDLLSNMKGVQKQTAKLIRQRYELKLNKWVRKQSDGEEGPPIGVMSGIPGSGMGQRGRSRPSPSPTPTPSTDTGSENQNDTDDVEIDREISSRDRDSEGSGVSDRFSVGANLRKERRKKRMERRNEAMDIAAEEVAKQMAPEVARELSQNFGTYFGLPAKILEAKAEQDPDWFIEKMDEMERKLGISFTDIMEESDTKKERRQQEQRNNQPKVDNELDDALNEVRGETEQEQVERETTKSDTGIQENEREMTTMDMEQEAGDAVEKTQDTAEEEVDFEDIFGGD